MEKEAIIRLTLNVIIVNMKIENQLKIKIKIIILIVQSVRINYFILNKLKI
jgi:hypothetical protein